MDIEEIEVDGRLVVVATKKTQTINICKPGYGRGDYSRKFRIFDEPSQLKVGIIGRCRTIDQLVELVISKGGVEEPV